MTSITRTSSSANQHSLQIGVFHAGTPGELGDQVNRFLAQLPAAYVRAVRFQTSAVAALRDEEPRWEYAALVEYEAER